MRITKPTYKNYILDLALLSYLNSLTECRNLPSITLSDSHQAMWLKLQWGMCSLDAGKHYVLSHIIDMKSLDLQLISSLLTAVNWRNIFANDHHVDDYITDFMHVLIMLFSSQYLRALYVIVN